MLVHNIQNANQRSGLVRGESFKGEKEVDISGAVNWLGRRVGNKGLSRAQKNFRRGVESVQDVREIFSGEVKGKTIGVCVGLVVSSIVFEAFGAKCWGVFACLGGAFGLSPGPEVLVRWGGIFGSC